MEVVESQQRPCKVVQAAVRLQDGQAVLAAVLRRHHEEGDRQLRQEGQVAQVQEGAQHGPVRAPGQRVDLEGQQHGRAPGQLGEGARRQHDREQAEELVPEQQCRQEDRVEGAALLGQVHVEEQRE